MRQEIEYYAEQSEEPLLFVEGHDNAILGLARQFNRTSVLYSKNKVIKNLMKDMTEDEALEFFEFNIVGAYVGEATPTFLEHV